MGEVKKSASRNAAIAELLADGEKLKNFYRLNADDGMIGIIADEYARLTGGDSGEMSVLLKKWTHEHDAKVLKRKQKKRAKKSRC